MMLKNSYIFYHGLSIKFLCYTLPSLVLWHASAFFVGYYTVLGVAVASQDRGSFLDVGIVNA